MKATKWILPIAALALVLAPAAQAKINVDYSDDADFSSYKTYAWKDGTPVDNQLIERRIRAAIDEQLAAKGWKKVEGEADCYLLTHASVEGQTRVDVNNFGYAGHGWGGWGGWHGYGHPGAFGSTSVNVREVQIGTLLVDILDGASGDLVWRAVATGTVRNNPSKSEKRINKGAAKMFRKFPPQP